MARDPLAFKYTGATNPDGTAAEFVPGIPSRDIHRAEFDAMSDAEKSALGASHLHRAYGKADEEAEAAAERVEQAPTPVDNSAAPAAPETVMASLADVAPKGKR